MKISLFPFAGADTEATRSPTPMDLDEGSEREVSGSPCQCSLCSHKLPATPTGLSHLDSPDSPDPPHSPNSPNYNLSSQEAMLQVTWWGAFQESMPARAWNPWPHCHFASLDHMEVLKITRPWAPSRLVIQETLAKSHLELESVILDLCSGYL